MAGSGGKMPDAFLSRWIRMGIVWTQNLAIRSPNFVLTASFFAIVSVFVKREPIVASANVRANSVATLLLTSAVVHSTFILICITEL